MNNGLRAGIAGIIGTIVAFGVAELIHGLYEPVPSVFTSLAQRVVQLTPGWLVTKGIEILGQADIPKLTPAVTRIPIMETCGPSARTGRCCDPLAVWAAPLS